MTGALAQAEARSVLGTLASRWSQACSPLRPRDVSRLYTDDAVFFGALPELFVGRSGVESYFASYGDSLSSISLVLEDGAIRSWSPDAFLFQGFADFRFGLPDGRQIGARFRATLGVVRADGEWLIGLHHFSPPAERSAVPM